MTFGKCCSSRSAAHRAGKRSAVRFRSTLTNPREPSDRTPAPPGCDPLTPGTEAAAIATRRTRRAYERSGRTFAAVGGQGCSGGSCQSRRRRVTRWTEAEPCREAMRNGAPCLPFSIAVCDPLFSTWAAAGTFQETGPPASADSAGNSTSGRPCRCTSTVEIRSRFSLRPRPHRFSMQESCLDHEVAASGKVDTGHAVNSRPLRL